MDEQEVFAYLEKQKKPILLDYLRAAFQEMTAKQCRAVFADAVKQPVKKGPNAEPLRKEIDKFRRDSLAGKYYAPFNVNSKNFMDKPAETEEWCDLFGRFVADTSKLTARGEHAQAVACFAMLWELLQAMENGEDVIFAEEVGSWMIPADEKVWIKDYLKSLAAISTPEAFAAAAVPLLQYDSGHSFSAKVHASIRAVANSEQKARVQAEVKRQKVRTQARS